MELEKAVERQVKNTMEYYKNLDNLEEVPIDILRTVYKDLLQELKDIHTDLQEIYVDMRINGSNYYADKLNKAMKGRLHWDKR